MREWQLALMALALGGAQPASAAPDERAAIASLAEFAELARTSPGGRYASFPQLMFVIDRAAKDGARLHFVNSRRFEYHIDYVRRTYLSTQSVEALEAANYSQANRRFIFGSVVHYPGLDRYGVEFWEGDELTADLLSITLRLLQPAFPAPIAFKPNSQPQLDLAASLPGLAVIDGNAIYGSRDELVLNPGRAVGRLMIVPRLNDDVLAGRDAIVVLGETPLRLSPVAGVIASEFSTPLSHVNLLAKGWRIPNGYLRGALTRLAAFDGKWVRLDAREKIAVRLATPKEVATAKSRTGKQVVRAAKADLTFIELAGLAELRASDASRVGAKAANLGEIVHRMARDDADFAVPPGFAIPFAWYERFLRENSLDKAIDTLLTDPRLRRDGAWRQQALAGLRKRFDEGLLPAGLLDLAMERRAAVTGAGGVFVRSSTNSEDLPGFNGAGLYTSVPNVIDRAALAAAIRTVWGSVWNDAAFAAREAAGIDHRSVKGGVLVHLGMNAEASGVMVTENPFDPAELGAVFINAKRGLGIRVVEGRRVAEQLLYRQYPESIQLLTRSSDDAMLSFDAAGGVREVAIEPGRVVLSDERARRLARAGQAIATYFRGVPQDIEWLLIGDTIHIVQSRPYLRGN